MNFSENTPKIRSIVQFTINGWLIEAEVVARNSHPIIDDQIFLLSNGSNARYNRRTNQWTYWINDSSSSSLEGEIQDLKII